MKTIKKKYLQILQDYKIALDGIKKLPKNAKLGVYIAYTYYLGLTKKIGKTKANELMQKRIRISNFYKLVLLAKAYIVVKVGLF